MSASQPPGRIGVFDSGAGGLTVVKEIIAALPDRDLTFIGDTARVPYGTRGVEVITSFALELARFLMAKDVALLVAACNTISSTCLDVIQEAVSVPVIGVVEPAVRTAAESTRTGRIGVIGTRATVASGVYERKLKEVNGGLEVFSQACPLFVPLVEEGQLDSPATRLIAAEYLACFRNKGIDVLILACTHYPILRRVIQETVGEGVLLVDSAAPTASELRRAVLEGGLPASSSPSYELYVTDAPERVSEVATTFFEGPLPAPLRRVTLA